MHFPFSRIRLPCPPISFATSDDVTDAGWQLWLTARSGLIVARQLRPPLASPVMGLVGQLERLLGGSTALRPSLDVRPSQPRYLPRSRDQRTNMEPNLPEGS